MRRPARIVWGSLFAVVTVAASLGAGLAIAPTLVQKIVSTEVSEGPETASLKLVLEDGTARVIRFERGRVSIDGRGAGTYERGGALDQAWRSLLGSVVAQRDPGSVQQAYQALLNAAVEGAEVEAQVALREALDEVVWTVGASPVARAQEAQTADTAPPAAEAAPEAVEPSPAPQRPRRARGGIVIEIDDLDDIVNELEDVWLDRGSILAEQLESLRTPVKVVAFSSQFDLPAGDTLEGSLLLWDTDASIAGVVLGDLVAFQGHARLEPGGLVDGNVLAVDGSVDTGEGEVRGAISELEGTAVLRDLRRPIREVQERLAQRAGDRLARRVFNNFAAGMQGLFGTLGFYVFFGLLGLLTVYFLRPKLETVADTVSASFGRSLLVGLAAEAIFPVACIVLAVLVLTIPLIPVYVLAMGLGGLFGYLAVAYAAGANILRQPAVAGRIRWTNAYARLLVGLAPLLLLFALAALMQIGGSILGPVFGLLLAGAILVTWLAGTAGLGAVVLSRFGTRRDFAGPPQPEPAPVGTGAPAGGTAEGEPAEGPSDAS